MLLKKLTLAGAALAMGATAIVPAAPAMAQGWGYGGDRYYGRDYRDNRRYDRNYRQYRGDRGRNYRGCERGDGGTVIGAIAGGLLGNQVAGRGDRTVGTILGGAAGAVAGRLIDKSDNPRGCRGL